MKDSDKVFVENSLLFRMPLKIYKKKKNKYAISSTINFIIYTNLILLNLVCYSYFSDVNIAVGENSPTLFFYTLDL